MAHNHKRKTRRLAYGSKRKREWCRKCDADLVLVPANKKRARAVAKKRMESQLLEEQ